MPSSSLCPPRSRWNPPSKEAEQWARTVTRQHPPLQQLPRSTAGGGGGGEGAADGRRKAHPKSRQGASAAGGGGRSGGAKTKGVGGAAQAKVDLRMEPADAALAEEEEERARKDGEEEEAVSWTGRR
jgi:hypothetical protein